MARSILTRGTLIVNVGTSLSSEPLDDMTQTDDVVAVVVHGEPGQDGDGDAGAGR
jgi:hypothetical protein